LQHPNAAPKCCPPTPKQLLRAHPWPGVAQLVAALACQPAQPAPCFLRSAPIKLEGLTVPEDVKPLFEPVKVGRYQCKHRCVYAPLTRCRAFGSIPQPDAAVYYSQRATDGGLMVAEGTCISPEAYG
jgi:hypothetical protein